MIILNNLIWFQQITQGTTKINGFYFSSVDRFKKRRMNKVMTMALAALLFAGCGSTKKMEQTNENQETIWVYSAKTPCEDGADKHCFSILNGSDFAYNGWTKISGDIHGFNYQPGQFYKLQVSSHGEGADKHYHMEKILETKADMTLLLNDIWILEVLEGEKYTGSHGGKHPRLEINMAERRVHGTAHCNNFFGPVDNVDETHIQFKRLASTMMACPGLKDENRMMKAFELTRTWKIDNMRLTLSDENGKELMVLRKID